MTAETASGQAWTTTESSAVPGTRRPDLPQRMDRMVRYGVWFVVVTRSLGDRRLQVSVITSAIGVYALASVIKNNQARPVRRTAGWYKRLGDPKNRHRLRRAQKPGKR